MNLKPGLTKSCAALVLAATAFAAGAATGDDSSYPYRSPGDTSRSTVQLRDPLAMPDRVQGRQTAGQWLQDGSMAAQPQTGATAAGVAVPVLVVPVAVIVPVDEESLAGERAGSRAVSRMQPGDMSGYPHRMPQGASPARHPGEPTLGTLDAMPAEADEIDALILGSTEQIDWAD